MSTFRPFPPQGRAARLTQEEAEEIAIKCLGVLSRDLETLGQFLAVTGVGPADLRALAETPEFLRAVLEFVMSDETILLTIASTAGIRPTLFAVARYVLEGEPEDLG